jgi:hypothetical protein
MGMGYSAASSWTIDEKDICGIVPEAWDKFVNTLNRYNLSTRDWADAEYHDAKDDICEELQDDKAKENIDIALKELYDAFAVTTSIGYTNLTLTLEYYDGDSGDRYDDLEDGAAWFVDGVTEKTSAGKHYESVLKYSRWTIFG